MGHFIKSSPFLYKQNYKLCVADPKVTLEIFDRKNVVNFTWMSYCHMSHRCNEVEKDSIISIFIIFTTNDNDFCNCYINCAYC